jgi:signal transduction histidine kinase
MQAYARLARLPAPQREAINLGELVKRVANLETRISVRVIPGPDVTVQADAVQLEQLLINILHNAAEAALETSGTVTAGWRNMNDSVEVFVRDTGPGIMNPTNLFVPFFTTKPGGSGIGLALSRQIAEAHGGSLSLANRTGPGCEALLCLPK